MPKRFAVALTFPGEYRDFVEQVANELVVALTKPKVFYDRFLEGELARLDLDIYLQSIYHDDSELIVVFLCKEYNEKEWCGLEFRAIRDLIKKGRNDEIMFVRLAGGDVKGIFGIDGFVNAQGRMASDIAEVILDRLGAIRAQEPSIRMPTFNVVGAESPSLSHRALLHEIKKPMAVGELADSELAPLVLEYLEQESSLELVDSFDPKWITVGIRVADSYYRLIRTSAGQRDWQRDFAKTATPILVGVARTLLRSADAQAVIVRLCEAVAQRLRLKLVWPDDPNELNDMRNDLYRKCLDSQEVESDSVLIVFQGLTVVGPG